MSCFAGAASKGVGLDVGPLARLFWCADIRAAHHAQKPTAPRCWCPHFGGYLRAEHIFVLSEPPRTRPQRGSHFRHPPCTQTRALPEGRQKRNRNLVPNTRKRERPQGCRKGHQHQHQPRAHDLRICRAWVAGRPGLPCLQAGKKGARCWCWWAAFSKPSYIRPYIAPPRKNKAQSKPG